MSLSLGLKAVLVTPSVWPFNTATTLRVATSQTRAVWSRRSAVTNDLPSWLNARHLCPSKLTSLRPIPASHTRAVPSAHMVTTDLPSGPNAARLMYPEHWRTASDSPVAASHTRAVPSSLVVSTSLPSRLNIVLSTPPR